MSTVQWFQSFIVIFKDDRATLVSAQTGLFNLVGTTLVQKINVKQQHLWVVSLGARPEA